MKRFLLIPLLSTYLVGCTTGFWTDASSPNHQYKDYDAMFAESISDQIKAELSGQQPFHAASWREYWIGRCQQVYDSPEMGAQDVQYIIDRRRQAGLPDIPEIDKMAVPSQK
jgi:hypothetical protein